MGSGVHQTTLASFNNMAIREFSSWATRLLSRRVLCEVSALEKCKGTRAVRAGDGFGVLVLVFHAADVRCMRGLARGEYTSQRDRFLLGRCHRMSLCKQLHLRTRE